MVKFNANDVVGKLIVGNGETFVVKGYCDGKFTVDVVTWNDDETDNYTVVRADDVLTVSEIEHALHFQTGKVHKFSYV